MKRTFILTLIAALVLSFFTGCGSTSGTVSGNSSGSSTASGSATENAAASGSNVVNNKSDSVDNRAQANVTVSETDFEDEGYLYENSIGDSLYFLIIKNNSEAAVSISGTGIAKDASGNMLSVDDTRIDILGPGETSIGYFFFEGVQGIETVEYQYDYKTSPYFYPVLGNLNVQQTLNDSNVTLSVTNESDICAQFVEAYALFMDADNNVINYSSTYITDNDCEIKPGKTRTAQLDCYGAPYDHVIVVLTGRSDGSRAETSQEVSDDAFEIREYMYENSIGDSLYFLAVTNNSTDIVSVSANGTAKSAADVYLGAADFEIDVLGPGETSIGYFYFDDVSDISKVDYEVEYSKDLYYSPVISNLNVEETVNGSNVILAVTNNGSETAEFVEAYALFFDASGKMVDYSSAYITDDDCEIKPGKTLMKQLESYRPFDTVQVFLTGRHSTW